MITDKKSILTAIVAIIIGFGVGFAVFHKSVSAPSGLTGAIGNQLIEEYDPYVRYNGGIKTNLSLQLNSSLGSELTKIGKGTCSLLGADIAQGASSTKKYGCFAPGVRSGDLVFAQTASSTLFSNGLGWRLESADASSTADWIELRITNNTGATNIPSTGQYGSTTPYFFINRY